MSKIIDGDTYYTREEISIYLEEKSIERVDKFIGEQKNIELKNKKLVNV